MMSTMAETVYWVMMDTAVENTVNIFTVNRLRQKEGNIRCLDEYKGLYGGFVYRVVVELGNACSAFS